jgi:hypothetical protein
MFTLKTFVGTLVVTAVASGLPVPSSAATKNQGQSQTRKPQPGRILTVVEKTPTPSTLAQLVQSVDLVAFARVDTVSPPQADHAPIPHIRRIQHLSVLEVLKGSIPPSQKIQVRQVGGTMEVDGREISVEYPMRLLERGDVVMVFLSRVGGSGDVYDVPYGDDSVILSQGTEQRMVLPSGLVNMPEFGGKPSISAPDFLAILRRISKGR